MAPVDYLVHASNLMLLISYSVRNILWLRWFAVAAAIIRMPYYLSQQLILWPPIAWGGVFTLINLFQIALIYWQRRPVVLTTEERALYNMGFQSIRPREFVSLVTIGRWVDFAGGEAIVRSRETTDIIAIPVSGSAVVSSGHGIIGTYRPGHVIGLALALTGTPSHVSIVFSERSRCMLWHINALREFLDRKPELRASLRDMVDRELAAKIETIEISAFENPPAASRDANEPPAPKI